jgi:hypothetical protein
MERGRKTPDDETIAPGEPQLGYGETAAYGETVERIGRERAETRADDERRAKMDNERTTPEGDSDDPLREMEQLERMETIRGEVDETSTRTSDRAIPASYGEPGGMLPEEKERR